MGRCQSDSPGRVLECFKSVGPDLGAARGARHDCQECEDVFDGLLRIITELKKIRLRDEWNQIPRFSKIGVGWIDGSGTALHCT